MSDSEQMGGEPSHESHSAFVTFLYLLLRDHIQASTVEALTLRAQPADLTNRFIAEYAENVASRLLQDERGDLEEELKSLERRVDEQTNRALDAESKNTELAERNEAMFIDIERLRAALDQAEIHPDRPWQEDRTFEDAVRAVVAHA